MQTAFYAETTTYTATYHYQQTSLETGCGSSGGQGGFESLLYYQSSQTTTISTARATSAAALANGTALPDECSFYSARSIVARYGLYTTELTAEQTVQREAQSALAEAKRALSDFLSQNNVIAFPPLVFTADEEGRIHIQSDHPDSAALEAKINADPALSKTLKQGMKMEQESAMLQQYTIFTVQLQARFSGVYSDDAHQLAENYLAMRQQASFQFLFGLNGFSTLVGGQSMENWLHATQQALKLAAA